MFVIIIIIIITQCKNNKSKTTKKVKLKFSSNLHPCVYMYLKKAEERRAKNKQAKIYNGKGKEYI